MKLNHKGNAVKNSSAYHFTIGAALLFGLITALAATVAAVNGKRQEHTRDAVESWDDVLGI